MTLLVQSPAPNLPAWAAASFRALTKQHALAQATWVSPATLSGDFDGDGKADIAVLVEEVSTHKGGVVIIHGGTRRPLVAGAGVEFGNGGDDFAWMDHWAVTRAKGAKSDALLVERTESGGGRIVLVNGAYRWRQVGD
jgi:hypothetical protein